MRFRHRCASGILALMFPPLAKAARVQGDVKLRSGPAGVTLIDGNPLLAPTAVTHLKNLGQLSDFEMGAVYHFVLVNNTETRVTKAVVKKGNRLTRVFLRALKKKTEKIVEYPACVETPDLKNKFNLEKDSIEVWIYASIGCPQVSVSQIARR
jgi:hypothetical protein